MPLNPNRACVNCGDPIHGAGDLCEDCMPANPGHPPIGASICPYCESDSPWEKMRRHRRDHENGRVEVLYYCPTCRAVIEAASWMER
jgi:NMD protein affecting ribosome stability and mRNA decay